MADKETIAASISAIETTISSIDTWVIICTALVVLGVGGEMIFGVWHWRLDSRLRNLRQAESQIHEQELAKLTKDTAEANARAAEANLELEKIKTPRILTPEQQTVFAGVVKDLGPLNFSMTVANNSEALRLMHMLQKILVSSGWTQRPSGLADIEIDGAGMVAAEGLEVQLPLQGDQNVWERTQKLAKALTDLGIPTDPKLNPRLKEPATINFQVGTKQY